MKFKFKAKTQAGETKEGMIEAANKEKAIDFLQKNGFFVVKVDEEKEVRSLKKEFMKYFDRVTPRELVIFYQQLATLVSARVPIISSLSAIREQNENRYFRSVLQEMINDIEDGTQLSSAMEKHKDVFSILAVSITRAGEASGNLKSSMEHIANIIEKNYNLTKRVKGALAYPAVVLVVFAIVGFLVLTFIVPSLLQMIKDLEVEVPWYTKVLMMVSDFLSNYWWGVLAVLVGATGALVYYFKTEEGSREWDRIKIRIPKIGDIYKGVYMTRFSENLAVLLASGIPIIKALTIVSAVTGNKVYEAIILATAEEVRKGGDMSSALKRYPLIPSIVTQMVKIGEESGKTDEILKEVADFYEKETDNVTKNLTTLIEPIMIILMGLAVGLLAIMVILPIYNVAGQLQ